MAAIDRGARFNNGVRGLDVGRINSGVEGLNIRLDDAHILKGAITGGARVGDDWEEWSPIAVNT